MDRASEAEAIVGKLCLGEAPVASAVRKEAVAVGDYLWLAVPKARAGDARAWRDAGVVVGPVVERKCVSDFRTTVKGGTHHAKQTLAMKRCGLPGIYVVEGCLESVEATADRARLHGEMARLELEDGFVVHRTDSFDGTARYLQTLDAVLTADLGRRSARDVLDGPDVAAYADVCAGVAVDEKHWPLSSKFGAFLLHVPSVKPEYVAPLLDAYATPAALKAALDAHALEEPLLSKVLAPGKTRRADAARVAKFFTDPEYARPPNPMASPV